MTTEKIFDEALKNILSEDEILKDEPMKHHTTFRVGGPAEYYLRPKKEQVAEVLRLCIQKVFRIWRQHNRLNRIVFVIADVNGFDTI